MGINSTVIPQNVLKLMAPEDRKKYGKAGMLMSEVVAAQAVKLERELTHDVVNYLNLRGIAFCQARTDKKSRMTVGWPDISCAIRSQPVAFELKTTQGKLSEHQIKCHERMRANGWHVFVIRSLESVVDIINRFSVDKT